ncbi:MAG: orotate phosphoribosyltransferase [Betaproteobacteria bacterium]|jgi:orotate phosphoribosyltransferase|nr:orotate phosphoribosyltransferase [Betaproteobacteria bacterium]
MSLPPTPDHTLAQAFIQFSLESGVLKFGSFTTKAGRQSPYFFNAGLFDDGAKLSRLAGFYAQALLQSDLQFDMIFGPAYKGIPLGAAVAVELARSGRNLPFAYNRKEAKDHGEGGSLVGAPLKGRVLIVDDVMSAGTAVRESIALIEKAGATAYGVAVALDRQEMATEVTPDGGLRDLPHSAVQYVRETLGLKVCAVAQLSDLLAYLGTQSDHAMAQHLPAVQAYRDRYGVT